MRNPTETGCQRCMMGAIYDACPNTDEVDRAVNAAQDAAAQLGIARDSMQQRTTTANDVSVSSTNDQYRLSFEKFVEWVKATDKIVAGQKRISEKRVTEATVKKAKS